MKFRKGVIMKRILYSFQLVFLLVSTNSLFGYTVDLLSCGKEPDELLPRCMLLLKARERTDSGINIVNPGIDDKAISQQLLCENCIGACPEVKPSAASCTSSLGLSYTETVSVTLAAGLEVSVQGLSLAEIEASLSSSIGHSTARTITKNVTCGSTQIEGCTRSSYQATLAIKTNIEKAMTHTYTWFVTKKHFLRKCDLPTVHTGPDIEYYRYTARTTQSTVVGSEYSTAASCETISFTNCN